MSKRKSDECSIVDVLQLISNKWVIRIMSRLLGGTMRFGQLGRELGDISPKMLAQQLKKLEKEGLIFRKVYAEIPPKVEYSLTEKAESLEPILISLIEWDEKYKRTD